jgi:RimJ/RimL family protein N-acetyltransferase
MTETFSIRRLLPEEWELFSAMRLRSLKEHAGSFGSSHEQESQLSAEQWQGWLKNDNKPVFGLFANERIIGITGLLADDKDPIAYMGMSYIIPDYRGRGLSALFYETRIAWAADYLPCERLRVAHRVGNEVAAAATRKAGLTYEMTTCRTWPDGTEGNQDWYQLNLDDIRRQRTARTTRAIAAKNGD